jgi:DNA-binding PadR family transcriptional regulator
MRFVFLALLASGPAHGYELKRRYDALFGAVWDPINVGQIYVTLGRLERDGLVTHTEVPQERGADRKDYELTELGRKALGGWLEEPAEVPVAKSDLLLRLVGASLAGADIGPLVGEHRQRCLQSLRDLDAAAGEARPGTVADLLIQGTALHLQAELRWLDRCDEVLLAGPVRLDLFPDPPGSAGPDDEGTAR